MLEDLKVLRLKVKATEKTKYVDGLPWQHHLTNTSSPPHPHLPPFHKAGWVEKVSVDLVINWFCVYFSEMATF